MNILLLNGHGGNPYDPGASGNGYKEAVLTRELAGLVANELKQYANVYRYPESRNAYQDVENGVFKKYLPITYTKIDYAFEIHFNAFNGKGHGSECYVTTSEKGITVEQTIMEHMSEYFTLRDNDNIFDGVKRTNFAVIKTLKSYGVSGALLETCFIDNASDMKIYTANKQKIAKGIAEGIAEGFGLKKKPTTSTSKPNTNTSSSTKYKKGDTVTINGVYTSSNSTKKLTPSVKTGKITSIINGAKNPYLLNNGDIGWVNDNCITGKSGSISSSSSKMTARQFALEVWNEGKHGTGETRKAEAKKYGLDYEEVQKLINKLASGQKI